MSQLLKSYRIILTYILIIMLALPAPYLIQSIGQSFAADKSAPVTDQNPAEIIKAELFEKEQVFKEQVAGLDQILRGLRSGVHPLDIWGALSQRMVYETHARGTTVAYKNMDIVIGDYKKIPEALSEQKLSQYLSWIFDVSDSNFMSEEGELLPAIEDKNGIISPIRPNSEEAKSQASRELHFLELQKLSNREALHLINEVSQRLGIRLDETALLLEKSYNTRGEKNSPFARVFNKDLIYSDMDRNQSNVISYSRFKDSTNSRFNTGNLLFEKPIHFHPRKPTFSFANSKTSHVFEELTIPIRGAFFYGEYLVFVENESGYNKDSKTQYLSFIDLGKYETSVGQVGLPIFKVALPSDAPIKDIRIENGKIKVGLINGGKTTSSDQFLDSEELTKWSDLNEVAYNAHVNLVDPNHVQAGSSMIEGFATYQEKATEFLYKDITQNEAGRVDQMQDAFGAHGKKLAEALSKSVPLFARKNSSGKIEPQDFEDIYKNLESTDAANYLQVRSIKQTMIEYGNAHHEMMRSHSEMWGFTKRLSNRAKKLSLQMQIPRPKGIPVIQKGLAAIAAQFNKNIKSDLKDGRYQSAAQVFKHPYVKWGTGVALTAIAATLYPEQAGQFLYEVHSMGASIFTSIFGFLGDMGYLAYESFRQNLKYLNPAFIVPFLWENGFDLMKAVGIVMATWVVIPASVVQFVNSTVKLGRDLYHMNPLEENKGHLIGRMTKYLARVAQNLSVKNFILQQRGLRKSYLDNLSAAARKRQEEELRKSGAKAEISANTSVEDKLKARELIKQIEEDLQAPFNSKWYIKGPRKAYGAVKAALSATGSAITYPYRALRKNHETKALEEADGTGVTNKKIKTFSSAIRHFLLSWPSFTLMQKNSAKFSWNSWFLFRTFSWHPIVFTKSILFPKSAFTIANPEGKTILPSRLNGAKRDLLSQLYLWFVQTDSNDEISKWEEAIIPVETSFHEQALEESLNSLDKFVTSQEELMDIYRHGKIDHYSAGKINRLHKHAQFFFKHYTETLQAKATEMYFADYLKKYVDQDFNTEITDLDQRQITSLINKSSGNIDNLDSSPETAKYYIKKAAEDGSILKYSIELARKSSLSPDKFKEQYLKQNIIKILNPKNNRQIERVYLVNRLLDDAGETARATRFVVSNWKLNLPITIALSFLASAGLEGGAYQLLQDDADGGESFMGFSKAVLVGMAFGLSLNVVGGADLWMQLQRNELNEGKFDQRLEGEQANMGLMPLWYQMSFKNPDNSFKKNYAHSINRLVIPNIKAATWNFIAAYAAMWGRFDSGFYLMGYLTTVLLPLGVLDQQMDQGFELAISRYLATKFPPELIALPEVQEFINNTSSKYRDMYTLFNKGFEELIAAPIHQMNVISTKEHGLRSFERILFNGWSVAEIAFQGLEELGNLTRPIPGASELVSTCAQYLTNNMPAEMFQNTQVPPWIKQ